VAGAWVDSADGNRSNFLAGPTITRPEYVAPCQTAPRGVRSDMVPGATVGHMGPGVPGLRGRNPFPSNVRLGGPDPPPPPSRGVGCPANEWLKSTRVSPGGSVYLVVPLGPEGPRHPEALARPLRGGPSRWERCLSGAFMGAVPQSSPVAFNAAWLVVRHPPKAMRQAALTSLRPMIDGWDRRQRIHAPPCVRRRGAGMPRPVNYRGLTCGSVHPTRVNPRSHQEFIRE
jgi:hypothetical protein